MNSRRLFGRTVHPFPSASNLTFCDPLPQVPSRVSRIVLADLAGDNSPPDGPITSRFLNHCGNGFGITEGSFHRVIIGSQRQCVVPVIRRLDQSAGKLPNDHADDQRGGRNPLKADRIQTGFWIGAKQVA